MLSILRRYKIGWIRVLEAKIMETSSLYFLFHKYSWWFSKTTPFFVPSFFTYFSLIYCVLLLVLEDRKVWIKSSNYMKSSICLSLKRNSDLLGRVSVSIYAWFFFFIHLQDFFQSSILTLLSNTCLGFQLNFSCLHFWSVNICEGK